MYRKHKPLIFVSVCNILVSLLLLILEVLNLFNILPANFNENLYFVDIIFMILVNNLLISLFIKKYQEIKFYSNNTSLCIQINILSIIFGILSEVYRRSGSVVYGLIIVLTSLIFINCIAIISNVYLTKLVADVAGYKVSSNLTKEQIIVVRNIKICNKKRKVKFVTNRDYTDEDKQCKLLIVVFYLLTVIVFCF